ncbi:MAG: thiamine phosphate synthase [Legionella sp.]|uniref:thiamine phosphate synthase n=1 Tax=Legionella sp. TaxID=459 RepID=UPI0039E48295
MNTVWVIAETEADQQTLQGLGVNLVLADKTADAVKIGSWQSIQDINYILDLLKNYSGHLVVDISYLPRAINHLLSQVDVLVLNIHEAEAILHYAVNSHEAMEKAAAELLNLGVKSVLLKGSQMHEPQWIHDYWSNGSLSFWLSQKRYPDAQYSEAGTVYSSAITAALVLGYPTEDAVVIAKMYVHQAIRLATTTLYYGGFPEHQIDLPYLASKPLFVTPQAFKRSHYLGLYPVVDSAQWVETLLKSGVKTIQLRIKECIPTLEEEIKCSIALAKQYRATLFINDYWELALKLGAEAVHLGQSDLDNADLEAIRQQGLLLGVSTYCYHEVAMAHAICPSYMAIGPIYPTTSKELVFRPQGIDMLARWIRTLNYPLVAIGGISIARAPEVVATGVSGVALISAITEADDPQDATRQLLGLM